MLLGLFIVSASFVNLLLSSITFHPNETEDEALLIGILEDTGILLLLAMFTELTILLPTLFLLFLLDEEENTGSKRWTLAFSRIALVDLKMKSLLLSCLGIFIFLFHSKFQCCSSEILCVLYDRKTKGRKFN